MKAYSSANIFAAAVYAACAAAGDKERRYAFGTSSLHGGESLVAVAPVAAVTAREVSSCRELLQRRYGMANIGDVNMPNDTLVAGVTQ